MSVLSLALAGLYAASGAQAATLACGPTATPLRISTHKDTWSTDARYVSAPTGAPAAIVDDYQWSGWLKKATATHPASAGSLAGQALQADWLSFGDSSFTVGASNSNNTTSGTYSTGTKPYPAVITDGKVANGALVARRVSFTYNEPITIGTNVDLSTIKLIGSGGFDDGTLLLVKPATTPSGATDWIRTSASFGGYGSPSLINVDGANTGMGFYYGDNTIGFAVVNTGYAPTTSAGNPTGLLADFQITADCLPEPEPVPTNLTLSCTDDEIASNATVEIGPFITNKERWTWSYKTVGGVLTQTTEPLFDDFKWRSWFNPNALPAGQETTARWISPGTTDPAASDLPGVPYPAVTGQHKGGYYGSVFTMNQAITVGDTVDLDSIKLSGRFGFDNTGDSVFVQPASAATYYTPFQHLLPDGFGGFTGSVTSPFTTGAIPGFEVGQNTIGLVLDGGEDSNACVGGGCAMGAIADFKITATCKAPAPAPSTGQQTIPFRAPNPGVYSATNGQTVAWSPALPASSSAGLPVTYTATGVCTVNSTTRVITLLNPAEAGTCTITASAAAGQWTDPDDNTHIVNIAAAPDVTQSIEITLLSTQEITFPAQESHDISDGAAFPLAPAASASSGLDVIYTSTTPAVCTVNATTGEVTPKKAGTCTIAANQPGNDAFAPAEEKTASIQLTGTMPVTAVKPVPALGAAGLGLLGLLSAGLGGLALRRRKQGH